MLQTCGMQTCQHTTGQKGEGLHVWFMQGMKSTIAVPQSIPGLVTKDLLVMTFIEGEQITRLKVGSFAMSDVCKPTNQ